MTEQFKAMNYFSTLAENKINKMTLIYGGTDNQQRSLHTVTGWRKI